MLFVPHGGRGPPWGQSGCGVSKPIGVVNAVNRCPAASRCARLAAASSAWAASSSGVIGPKAAVEL